LLLASVALSRVASAEQCPADFDEFIGAFETSAEFQIEHWKRPLTYRYLEASANAEPQTVEVAVTLENAGEFAGVEFPSAAQRAQEKLEKTVTAPDPKTRVVRLSLEHSDFEITYVFQQTAACWELARVEDAAL
jgi:hypothetical protein